MSKPNGGATGVIYPPPAVNNQGWMMKPDGTVRAVASGKCLEVCYRGGAVGGCDGQTGSVLQLGACQTPPSQYQRWRLSEHGALALAQKSHGSGSASGGDLCAEAPRHGGGGGSSAAFDLHSIVSDPQFVDPAPEVTGNFDLKSSSPAVTKLGFQPIPKIEAPTSRCGGGEAATGGGCLAAFFALQQER
jgi:hypothetical protein